MVRLRPREFGEKIYDQTTTGAWTYGMSSLSQAEETVITVFNAGVAGTYYRISVTPDVTNVPVDWHDIKAATLLGAGLSDWECLGKPWDAVRVGFISGAVTARAYVRMDMKQ